MKSELYPLFGGYWGYVTAPLDEVIRQRLVLIARHRVEAEQHAEHQAKLAERQAEIEAAQNRR